MGRFAAAGECGADGCESTDDSEVEIMDASAGARDWAARMGFRQVAHAWMCVGEPGYAPGGANEVVPRATII